MQQSLITTRQKDCWVTLIRKYSAFLSLRCSSVVTPITESKQNMSLNIDQSLHCVSKKPTALHVWYLQQELSDCNNLLCAYYTDIRSSIGSLLSSSNILDHDHHFFGTQDTNIHRFRVPASIVADMQITQYFLYTWRLQVQGCIRLVQMSVHCSKCLACSLTHGLSRFLHSLTAELIMICCRP